MPVKRCAFAKGARPEPGVTKRLPIGQRVQMKRENRLCRLRIVRWPEAHRRR